MLFVCEYVVIVVVWLSWRRVWAVVQDCCYFERLLEKKIEVNFLVCSFGFRKGTKAFVSSDNNRQSRDCQVLLNDEADISQCVHTFG